jgi:hypothetical protein
MALRIEAFDVDVTVRRGTKWRGIVSFGEKVALSLAASRSQRAAAAGNGHGAVGLARNQAAGNGVSVDRGAAPTNGVRSGVATPEVTSGIPRFIAPPLEASGPRPLSQPIAAPAVPSSGADTFRPLFKLMPGATAVTQTPMSRQSRRTIGANGGRPLDENTRRQMESFFGASLGDVRIHADANAAQFAANMGAEALTVGRDIYFGAGRFDPSSQKGKALLGHELTHVLQQRTIEPRRQGMTPGSVEVLESEAQTLARRFETSAAEVQGTDFLVNRYLCTYSVNRRATDAETQRLEALSRGALRTCEEILRARHLDLLEGAARTLDTVTVDIDTSLAGHSDEDIVQVWGRRMAAAIAAKLSGQSTPTLAAAAGSVLKAPDKGKRQPATTNITVRTETFDIEADNLDGTAAALQGLDEWGKTRWNVTYDYDATDGVATSVSVTARITVELPRWTSLSKQPRRVQAEWNRMLAALRRHENEHVRIARERIQKLAGEMSGKPESELPDIHARCVQELDTLSDDFDTRTDHGQKEGVTLDLNVAARPKLTAPNGSLERAETEALALEEAIRTGTAGRPDIHGATPDVVQHKDSEGGKSKADQIREELDSLLPSNSKLEELWASFGTGLPEVINETAYRDLWWRSVNDEEISLIGAGRPLLGAFASDTIAVARAHVSSQHTRLENLHEELKRAAQQKVSRPAATQSTTGGIEDPASAMSRSTGAKPLTSARGLVDSATVLHFLENWQDILKTAPIGMRRLDTSNLLPTPAPPRVAPEFKPFPNSPVTPPTSAFDDQSQQSLRPILFDPNVTVEKILGSPDVEFIDREAHSAMEKVYRECLAQASLFRELANALKEQDANLAVLAEKKLLGQVSALSDYSDEQAGNVIMNMAAENAKAAKRFLDMLSATGTVDWMALRPVHAHLLAGGPGGGRNWSNITARGFVDHLFKKHAEAELERAKTELILQLALAVPTFVALLTPAAPLAAAFLLATDAAAVAVSVAQSSAADKKAEVLSAGAATGVVSKDDAARAKEVADAKKASMVVDILLNALPYLPNVAKGGAKVASALGRKMRWENLAKASMVLGAGPAVGDLVVDLAKAGVSAIARNRAGGSLSLNYMVSRIRAIDRLLGWSRVGAAAGRGGDETLLHLGSKYGLKDYVRYHVHGPGLGREAYPIFLAPTRANQFVNNHVEGFMRRHRDAGAVVDFSVRYATYSGVELRPFIEGLLKSGDPQIINRLALDQGLMEKFLKSAIYDIRIQQGGTTTLYRASVGVGAPGSGAIATQVPLLLP